MKVISELTGGFGNQLFAYACAYAYAKKQNADLYINTYMSDNGMTRELGIDKLKIEYTGRISFLYKRDVVNRAIFNKLRCRKAIGLWTKIYKVKENVGFYPEVFSQKPDIMLRGCWQSDRYFQEYEEDIRRMFQPNFELCAYALEQKTRIEQDATSVAVHIRRGDYLIGETQLNYDYYPQAIAYVRAHVKNPHFYFFSDDIEWVKEQFGEADDFYFVSDESKMGYMDEFFVMASCKHDIIANSSFSWWATYLNPNKDKVVTCPRVNIWRGDFYPEKWIQFDASIAQETKGEQ